MIVPGASHNIANADSAVEAGDSKPLLLTLKLRLRDKHVRELNRQARVSSEKLARTRMAKSVLDAGWSTLRRQLEYKAMRHGSRYIEVDEAYTTQVCSCCGALPDERPKGIADLGIRQWTCGGCGTTHDRDVNAALNIARLGLETLVEGASA